MTTKAFRIPVLTLYLYELGFSLFYFVRDLGTAAEMPLLPMLGATASVVTVLYYSLLGLLLYNNLGWRSLFPLAVMGGIQEYAYNLLNLFLTPGFLRTVLDWNPHWFVYLSFVGGLIVVAWFLQSKLLEPRYRLNWASFLFPAYLGYYAFTLAYIVRFTIPGWLNLFILTLFISYLKTVRTDRKWTPHP